MSHSIPSDTELCDHCGTREAEYRHKEDERGGFCLECIRDHGEDESEYEVIR